MSNELIPELVTTEEASRLLGVTKKTLYEWRKKGCSPAFIKLGNGATSRVCYTRQSIAEWLENHKQAGTDSNE